MRLQPDQQIGRFRVVALIGTGGMAEVWSVVDSDTGEQRALKVLSALHPAQQHRLAREGRAQARLKHPNLLAVEGIVDVGGTPGLLMPLIEGPALDTQLRADGTLNSTEALSVVAAVADGLRYAHAHGLVHRDIKLGNVLLDRQGGRVVPRLADFGLVKVADSSALLRTQTGTALGTPAYAAPEQLQDAGRVSDRADTWSLGIALVELLTGQRPFKGTSLLGMIEAQSAPPDLSAVPTALLPLVSAMLAPDPAERPSADAVYTALRRLLAGTVDPLLPGGSLAARLADYSRPAPRPLAEVWTWASGESLDVAPRFPHNLRDEPNPLVGRIDTLLALGALLKDNRLVTIIGPGGAGKTRIARHLGRDVLLDWPGGVWLVDLSEVQGAEALRAAVADVLGAGTREDALRQALANRPPTLLILDNIDQVGPAGPDEVSGWLRAAPQLTLVATSRQPLRVDGEQRYLLPPLAVKPAAALFIARVRQLRGRYSVDAQARADIDELVSLLDGLPLAIELAAARARSLSPRQITARLSRRFALLKSRDDSLPPRQRSLRAALAWSWEQLSPHEQSTLAQCSLFEGPFSLEAAEAVVDLSAHPDADFLEDVIDELCSRGLLQLQPTTPPTVRALLSVQAFAGSQRGVLGLGDADVLRHAAHFASATPDVANLLVAIERTLARGEADLAGRCLGTVAAPLKRGSAHQTLLHLTEAVLAHGGLSAEGEVSARMLRCIALHRLDRNDEAVDEAARVRAQAAAAGLLQQEARALLNLGMHMPDTHDARDELLAAAAEKFRAARDTDGVGQAAFQRARLRYNRGDIHGARPLYEEALEIFEACGRPSNVWAMALYGLGMLIRNGGDPARGRALHREARERFRAARDIEFESIATSEEALSAMLCGDLKDAESLLEEGLAQARATGSKRAEGVARHYRALAAYFRGHLPALLARARLFGQLDRIGEPERISARILEGMALCAMGRLDEATVLLHEACTQARGVGYGPLESSAAMGLGEVALRAGDLDEAGRWIQAGTEQATRLGIALYAAHGQMMRGRLARRQGDPQAAETLRAAQQALAAARDLRLEGIALRWRGQLALETGEPAPAAALLEESQARLEAAGAERDLAETMCWLATARDALGRPGADALRTAAAAAAAALEDGPGTLLHDLLTSAQRPGR